MPTFGDDTQFLDETFDNTMMLSADLPESDMATDLPPIAARRTGVAENSRVGRRESAPDAGFPGQGVWVLFLVVAGVLLASLMVIVMAEQLQSASGGLLSSAHLWLSGVEPLQGAHEFLLANTQSWMKQALLVGAVVSGLLALFDRRVVSGSKPRVTTPQVDERLSRTLEGLPDACLVLNRDRRVAAHNSSVFGLLKQQRDVHGADVEALYREICPDSTMTREALSEWLDNLHADSTSSLELMDHRNRHLLIRERPTANGEITAIIRDISDAKEAARALREATDFDQLTGLPNRALFMRKLRGYTRSLNNSVALMVCDIRNFRQINDSYGQEAGDLVLASIAATLVESMPQDAVIARIAGDEFGVMIHPIHDRDQFEDSIRGFLDLLRSGVTFNRRIIPVSASVGVAYAPEHGTSPMALKNAADSACALAKTSINGIGAHVFSVYDPAFQAQADRMHRIDAALHQSINRGELQLEYQPQVDIATNLTVGMEALVRWESRALGKVSPAEFIPLAERSGFILTLGDWVLKHAIEDYKQLALFGTSPGALSVNISRRQFDDLALVDKLCDVLMETHMRPDLLTLEITETAILENRDRAVRVLQQLSDLGVNLSIDDFGVGYSSFLELRDFPISEVKIDRSFVKNVDTCDNSRKIIQAIISVADAIGAKVVAEGIETRAQLESVRALGCHRAQGYFLCEPMSATTFPDLVLGS